MKIKKLLFCVFSLLLLSSCVSEDDLIELKTSHYLSIKSGDILVMSVTNRSVVQLDKDGNYLDTLYVAPIGSTLRALTWDNQTKSVLIGVLASTSRIISISSLDKSEKIISLDTNLTTGLAGLIKTSDNEYIFAATGNSIRKLNSLGVYKAAGGFPITSGLGGTLGQISLTNDGSLLGCSQSSGFVRIFNSSGVLIQSSAGSGIAGTTSAYGCLEMADGKIAIAWNGTTDTIGIYDRNNLDSALYTYSDTSILTSPRALAINSNNNILAIDNTNHLITEISPTGKFIRTIGEGLFTAATHLISIP